MSCWSFEGVVGKCRTLTPVCGAYEAMIKPSWGFEKHHSLRGYFIRSAQHKRLMVSYQGLDDINCQLHSDRAKMVARLIENRKERRNSFEGKVLDLRLVIRKRMPFLFKNLDDVHKLNTGLLTYL